MLNRDRLESLLNKLSDDDFATVYKNTYGSLPFGCRVEVVRDFVAEQYDSELEGCISIAESFLTRAPSRPKTSSSKRSPR
jgi:hypothetical protein